MVRLTICMNSLEKTRRRRIRNGPLDPWVDTRHRHNYFFYAPPDAPPVISEFTKSRTAPPAEHCFDPEEKKHKNEYKRTFKAPFFVSSSTSFLYILAYSLHPQTSLPMNQTFVSLLQSRSQGAVHSSLSSSWMKRLWSGQPRWRNHTSKHIGALSPREPTPYARRG